MIIGSRIKENRLKKGLSQEQLGKLLNVSKVSICGYENGSRTPTLKTFLDITDILNMTPDYLLGRDTSILSEEEYAYTGKKISAKDLEILKELKTKPVLYNKLFSNPKRTVELISRKII